MTRYPFGIGNIAFSKIEDMLTALGWKPDMSTKAQAERRAWQGEAAMSHRERMKAIEARRKKSEAA